MRRFGHVIYQNKLDLFVSICLQAILVKLTNPNGVDLLLRSNYNCDRTSDANRSINFS